MLLACWSPKGGSGTSVLAAVCALVLAREAGGARLADLGGDQPAILGLADDPRTGLSDWLAAGPDAPTEALGRLALDVAPGLQLLPRGQAPRALVPHAAAEAGAALAVALRDGPVPVVVDAGTASLPADRAVVEVADHSVAVLRGCYLALRRAVHTPALEHASGVVLLEEVGRSLGAREVADVVDRPVLARVSVRADVARTIDAGVLTTRLPDALARPVTELLGALGVLPRWRGRAA